MLQYYKDQIAKAGETIINLQISLDRLAKYSQDQNDESFLI
jgi:hypothetical protein